ncbi:class I SAM-dependent methyltransferase [Arenibacter sp. F26102]|uniref:class I SAM-dependent methyltransferase n=1 Tax=Arenibacter sp. F26102 TaxID=2926416 RepID=UPI001FF53223|nr:class I SAM-dependent methyltransferase [Arenibacter sp. F26102]MCK0145392.1 class I SAM-dependent methyltransferase [Arenibacter sp. F26102]
MGTIETFDTYVSEYEQWYKDHPEVYESEILALKEQFQKLPQNLHGIEIGVGTGRFAEPLGIKEGIEPSKEMAKLAIKRGIEIMDGTAERLPYGDMTFNFVLLVTICFLKDVKRAFRQAHRVLKPNGAIIIGFLDKDRSVAKEYEQKRHRSHFYKDAQFYSVAHITKLLTQIGFKNIEFNQTLFGDLDAIDKVQMPKPGFGEGSFVVVKATKK